MSLVIHEAYSFDSQELELFWWDDFLGDSIADEWYGSGVGSAGVIDQQTGGILRMTTGAVSGNSLLLSWNDIRSLHIDKRVAMEVRLKPSVATYINIRIWLYFDGSNRCGFTVNETVGGAINWDIESEDGGATTSDDSGIALDALYHRFRIQAELHGGSHIHFYIDSPTECANSPITTNIPDDATDYLQPYYFIRTRENATKSIDLDYVGVRQLI